MSEQLRLIDFSDLELLEAFERAMNEDGEASSHEIALELELETMFPARNIGSRMGWLARYGAIERGEGKRWRLTTEGERMFAARRLDSRRQQALERMSEEEEMAVTHWLSTRMLRTGATAFALIRRELRHGEGQRKLHGYV